MGTDFGRLGKRKFDATYFLDKWRNYYFKKKKNKRFLAQVDVVAFLEKVIKMARGHIVLAVTGRYTNRVAWLVIRT